MRFIQGQININIINFPTTLFCRYCQVLLFKKMRIVTFTKGPAFLFLFVFIQENVGKFKQKVIHNLFLDFTDFPINPPSYPHYPQCFRVFPRRILSSIVNICFVQNVFLYPCTVHCYYLTIQIRGTFQYVCYHFCCLFGISHSPCWYFICQHFFILF